MRLRILSPDDKFHDECGVFGVFGHPEASNLAYLGIHALQHRGQESGGIASWDGVRMHLHKAMGLVEHGVRRGARCTCFGAERGAFLRGEGLGRLFGCRSRSGRDETIRRVPNACEGSGLPATVSKPRRRRADELG